MGVIQAAETLNICLSTKEMHPVGRSWRLVSWNSLLGHRTALLWALLDFPYCLLLCRGAIKIENEVESYFVLTHIHTCTYIKTHAYMGTYDGRHTSTHTARSSSAETDRKHHPLIHCRQKQRPIMLRLAVFPVCVVTG